MILVFISYLGGFFFLILINLKKYNLRCIFLAIMFLGFCLAFLGLASYTEYICLASFTENLLFKNFSEYIWKMDYYLKMDINKAISFVNMGAMVYTYSALCFSASFWYGRISKRWTIASLTVLFAALTVLYDPGFIATILDVNNYNPYSVNPALETKIQLANLLLTYFLKFCNLLSIVLLLLNYRKIFHLDRSKLTYTIIPIVPVHITFFILFYWYPMNNNARVWRATLLSEYNLPINNLGYDLIIACSIVSLFVLCFASIKYNIFELSAARDRIKFDYQIDTAREGINVFTHSIKNYFVAIKMLAEQIKQTDDITYIKTAISDEIINICDTSVAKFTSTYKNMSVVQLKYTHASLNEIITELINRYKKINPTVEFTFESNETVHALIDISQFARVIENLITNSIEACAEASLSGSPPRLLISLNRYGNDILIQVLDNGVGINPSHEKKVFRPFYSTKPTHTNWGIGLSYCLKVIESFGGNMSIASPGLELKGTTVKIYLPLS